MRRTALFSSLALVAVVGLVVTGAGVATGQTEIHVVASGGKVVLLDIREDGLGNGDRFVYFGPLSSGDQTERVGKDYWDCAAEGKRDGALLWHCRVLLSLADGQITLEGLDPTGTGSSSFAVTGGTATYAGARGDGTFTDTEDTTDIVITLID